MITSNGKVQAVAGTVDVASRNPGAPAELTQETLRQVAEAVRGAFPRPSANCELVLLDVDPRHLHAFWNIPPDQIARLRSEVAAIDEDPPLVLRIAEVSPQGKPIEAFDIEVIGLQGQFYVDIWDDARRYQGTIGLRLPDGALVTLARSNVIDLPRGGVSDDNTWREIALPAPPPTAAAARTAALPHAPSFTPAAAAPSTSPSPSPSLLPSPAAANETLPVASRAVATHPQPTVVTPPIASERTAAAVMPPAVAAAVPDVGFGDPLAPGLQGATSVPCIDRGEPVPQVPPEDATVPALEPVPVASPAIEHPFALAADELTAAIARHETEAVAPLAPFPYYEPEAAEAAPEVLPSEEHSGSTADSGDDAPTTAAEPTPAASEGPEPVPLPLENVLALSSFAVAGGPVEFEVNAELHIFGRAKPGMKLQMFGRPVPIRPDGTFTINRPLPNGAVVLSLLLAKNGEGEE